MGNKMPHHQCNANGEKYQIDGNNFSILKIFIKFLFLFKIWFNFKNNLNSNKIKYYSSKNDVHSTYFVCKIYKDVPCKVLK